jgi:uncharacterized membrane protein
VDLGNAAGEQCAAYGVNDFGVTVGRCIPGNPSGVVVAWVSTAGSQTALPTLAPTRPCVAHEVTNGGVIVGLCVDASFRSFGVTWNAQTPASAPLKLNPLGGLLGLIPDVSTDVLAFNQAGFVAGRSIGAGGTATAVLWSPGSGAPMPLSTRGDNCTVVDMSDTTTNGYPAVLLNCPSAGRIAPRVATRGLLGFVATNLPVDPASLYCSAAGIDNAFRVVGTCVRAELPLHRAAYWASPSTAPRVLTYVDSSMTPRDATGLGINNLGHLVLGYQMGNGGSGASLYAPSSEASVDVPSIVPDTSIEVVGFGDNDLVTIVGNDADKREQAAVFNPVTGVLSPLAPLVAGTNSVLNDISVSGYYAAGAAELANQHRRAVMTSLP